MKKLFRKLALALMQSLGMLAPVRKLAPALKAFATRLSRRVTIAVGRFNARVASVLTVPAAFSISSQSGYSAVAILISGAIAIVAIIIIFAYVVPQAYVASGNMTTAMTTAGATTESIQWWRWLMWGGIVLVAIGIVMTLVKGKAKF